MAADNLSTQLQINKLIEAQGEMLTKQSKVLENQVKFAEQMVAALSKANFKGMATDIDATADSFEKAQENAAKFGGENQKAFEKVNSAVKESADDMEDLGNKVLKSIKHFAELGLVAGASLTGFTAGLKFTGNMMKNVLSLGGGMLSFMGNLAASIISIPFKMLSGLISMADTGGSNELQQALEDVRKEFGALHATAGKAIIDISRSMKGQLATTGLSTWRVMGNLAERIKTIAEYAKNLGNTFEQLAPQILKNSEAFAAYTKGLGMSAEGQKALGARALASGQDITELQRQITNYSVQLGKSFGLSSKLISRDMGDMMADFKHFGTLGPQVLAQVSTYARKLGIDIKALTGVMDKWDNFEDAAQAAAHLSQSFGLNIDALEMMKEQDPAKRTEMMRKAFFAAGRSVENMTRQERALLATQTGLSDDALALTFSLKNQSMSYADVQKKGDAAHKKQLTQAESMKALADSIERLVKSGSAGSGGFFDRFIQGFGAGVVQSREFRGLMRDINRVMRDVFNAGRQVGRMFVEMFPGVKEILNSLRDMFNPTKFRGLMSKVKSTFREFFDMLTKDPQTALPKLLENLKKNFFDFFNASSPAGHRLLSGFGTFFIAIGHIAAGLLKTAMEGVKDGIRYIVDLLQGKKSISAPAGTGRGLGFMGSLFQPMIQAVVEAWPALWSAIKDMFGEVWKRVQPWIMEHLPIIIGVLFGPALFGMITRGLVAGIGGSILSALGMLATGGGMRGRGAGLLSRAFGSITHGANAAGSAAAGAGSGVGGAGAIAAGGIDAASQAANAAQKFRAGAGAIAKLALIALILGVGIVGIIRFGIIPLARTIDREHLSVKAVLEATAVVVGTAGAIAIMAGAVAILNIATKGLNASGMGRIAIGLVMIGAMAYGMAWVGKKIINDLKDIKTNELATASLAMTAIGTFFGIAALITGGVMALGTIIGGSLGAGAGALAVGLVALAAVTASMASGGMLVLSALNRFQITGSLAEFEAKTKAFNGILSGIGSFAGIIKGIIDSVRPSFSFFSSAAGDNARLVENMSILNTVIMTISTSLVNIVNSITRSLSSLTGSAAQLKAGEMFGSILGAVGELAKAIAPPMENLQDPGFFQRLAGAEGSVSGNLQAFGGSFTAISAALGSVITMITSSLTRLSGASFSETALKAVELIPSLMTAVANLASAIKIDPKEASAVANSSRAVAASGQMVRGLLDAITGSHLIENVVDVLNTFIHSIANANITPANMELLKAAIPAVTAIFGSIGAVANAVSVLVAAQSGPHPAPFAVSNAIQFAETLLGSIGTRLTPIFNAMTSAFGSLTPAAAGAVSKGAQAFAAVMTAMQTFTSMPELNIGDINLKFAALLPALSTLQVGIQNVAAQIAGSTGFGGAVRSLEAGMTNLGLGHVKNVLHDLIAQVNSVTAELNGMHPINIETGLHTVANNLGLGADQSYTVANRNFTIVVNLSVKFDPNGLDAFELALLNRTTPQRTRIVSSGH